MLITSLIGMLIGSLIACRWDESVTAAAADGGHLSILRWLRYRKCPWDASTCAAAAKRGFLPILQWARKNHCPWDDSVPLAAVAGPETMKHDQTGRGGDAAVFFWCARHDAPRPPRRATPATTRPARPVRRPVRRRVLRRARAGPLDGGRDWPTADGGYIG